MFAGAANVFDDLAVFVAVAHHASFIAASKQLSIPTSTVSRAVARLEEQLGVQLLRRTSRKVVVTDEGQRLLVDAAPHLEGLNEALLTAKDQQPELSGVVRVTAPAYTGATRITRSLSAFAAKYPNITIELDASNAIRDLLRDGFDFGIRVGEGVTGEVVARRLWRGTVGLYASPGFVRGQLDGRKTLTRESIEHGPCVVLRSQTVWRFRDAAGRPLALKPRPRFAVNDPRAVVTAARSGLGIALAPSDAVASDSRGLVELTFDAGVPEPIDLYLVHPTRRLTPRRVRLAMDWLISSASA